MSGWPLEAQSTIVAALGGALLALTVGCGRAAPNPVTQTDDHDGVAAPTPAASKDYRDDLAALARRYGIQAIFDRPTFPVATRHGVIRGRAATASELEAYAGLFTQEFGRYPPELVRRARLASVVLCAALSFEKQPRNAIPDAEHHALYLEVSRGMWSPDYMRRALHHDFFHLVDYRDDGLVTVDSGWERLNAPGVPYGDGGTNAQVSDQEGVLTDRWPGFLDHYATTGVDEDKAEVFSVLMCDPDYVARRCESDAVLKSKVERMKALMAHFCPEAPGLFWASAGPATR